MDNSGTRIQKVLSDNGILSRRKAEEAILQKRVQVNGRPCEIGQKVNPRKDVIALDGVNIPLQKHKNNVYIMLNKPRGYVTTTSDEQGRSCVADLVKDAPEKVYPIGRLDKVSEGLLLLTNDGDFANTVMHPRNHVSKTYRATVRPEITEEQILQLSLGVEVEGQMTLPAVIHVVTREQGRAVLQITIYEGRNRQIRKMCESVGLEVARLKRTNIGPVKLGMLKSGEWRELTSVELQGLRSASKKAEDKETQRQIDERVKREGTRSERAKAQNRQRPNAPRPSGAPKSSSAPRPSGAPKSPSAPRPSGPPKSPSASRPAQQRPNKPKNTKPNN